MKPVSFAKCHLAPATPGIYLIYTDVPFAALDWKIESGPMYIGRAQDGLRRRLVKEHNADTGRSTLRRTLGALLREELNLTAMPRRGRGKPKPINFTNFTFAEPGDRALTAWMEQHLSVTWLETTDPGGVESDLIRENRPPLNLTGFSNPHSTVVRAVRAACAAEARMSLSEDKTPPSESAT